MPRALIILVGIAAAVVVLFGIREVAPIAGPVVLALVLVIAVSPVRGWLQARSAPVWIQVAVPFLIVVLVLLGMVAILTISVTQLVALLPAYTDQFEQLLADSERWAATHGLSNDVLNKGLQAFDPGRVLGLAQTLLGSLIGILSALFLIVVLLLAMSLDAPMTARILTTGEGSRPQLVTALAMFGHKTRRYLIVSTVFGLINAILDMVALSLLDVPLPLLWGVLALIANYIPNIGFVIGLLPPAMLALLDGGVKTMLLVIAAYIVINVVTQSFILPKFLGDAVGLSTTMTFISLIVWTFVLGPLGAILAIPLSLLTRALLIDSDPSAKWVQALVSGRLPSG
ncbi:putative PurR-regulated permease PerM [Nonomuraea thailandensis]|uniref:PurR-regulated permease PerM n=1 Tax=Nonomuraea thailandensis TaxID=1188745 RepID=A0A9X2GVE3_9ACTN|nr:AI-2E family transporter [Nonomuraea thailandensis]MCP2361108.1 putative PurR-regulated permease PerM [Nonomuraea thailandensis]